MLELLYVWFAALKRHRAFAHHVLEVGGLLSVPSYAFTAFNSVKT
jgi:hypothetical protein